MKRKYLSGVLFVCAVAACSNVKIRRFTATPSTVFEGGPVHLEWEVSYGEKCTLHDFTEGQEHSVEPAGEKWFHPVSTSTYEIGCRSDQYMEGAHKDIVVQVIPAEETTVFFEAAPEAVSSGDTAILAWDTTFPDACTIEPGTIEASIPTGYLILNPVETTTYSITCWLDSDPGNLSKTLYAIVAVLP